MTDATRRWDPGSGAERAGRTEVVAIVAITLLGLVLRLYGARRALAMDELNNVWLATGGKELSLSVNALLYLPLIRLLHSLSTAELTLRLPAILAGTATLPLFSWTGRRLFGASVGLVSALLLAVSPAHIALSQLVHSYSLFCLLSVLALYLATEVAENRNLKAVYALAILLAGGMYLHLYTAFVAFGCLTLILIHGVGRWRAQQRFPGCVGFRVRDVVLPGGIAVVLVLPLLYRWMLPLAVQLVTGSEEPEPDSIWASEARFGLSLHLFRRLYRQLLVWEGACPRDPALLLASAALLLAGAAFLFRKDRKATSGLAIWILAPIYPIALLSQAGGIDFGTRRFVFILPQLLLLVAGGVCAAAAGIRRISAACGLALTRDRRWPLEALLAVVLASTVSVAALPEYYHDPEAVDYRLLASFLESVARPGDFIAIWKPEYVGHYYDGPVELHEIRFMTMTELLALSEGRRVFFLRPPPELTARRWPAFTNVEDWFARFPSLDIPHGRGAILVSFQERRPADAARLLTTQTRILATAVEMNPRQWRLRWQLAELYARQDMERRARIERRLARRLREQSRCRF